MSPISFFHLWHGNYTFFSVQIFPRRNMFSRKCDKSIEKTQKINWINVPQLCWTENVWWVLGSLMSQVMDAAMNWHDVWADAVVLLLLPMMFVLSDYSCVISYLLKLQHSYKVAKYCTNHIHSIELIFTRWFLFSVFSLFCRFFARF